MNKNTKQRFKAAQKEGQSVNMTIRKTYKGASKGQYREVPVTIHIAKPDGSGVISENSKRNMRMRVLHNKGAGKDGNGSLTVHEPIHKDLPCNPLKHKNYGKNRAELMQEAAEGGGDGGGTFVKIPRKPTVKTV